jgi:hypothetical protein
MPKRISEHVADILNQIEQVQKLSVEQRIQFGHELYRIMQSKQRDDAVVDPLIPETDRLTPIVARYVQALKPSDVLDDPPSSIRGIVGESV